MNTARHATAVVGLLVATTACHGSSSEPERTTPPIWEEGEWSVESVVVIQSSVPNPSTFVGGDRVVFAFDGIVAEQRGELGSDLSRAAIEAQLGFPLDEYDNSGSEVPARVELRYAVDRLQHAERWRFERTLSIQPGDWGMPPTLHETWRLERPGEPDEAWQVGCSFAKR